MVDFVETPDAAVSLIHFLLPLFSSSVQSTPQRGQYTFFPRFYRALHASISIAPGDLTLLITLLSWELSWTMDILG